MSLTTNIKLGWKGLQGWTFPSNGR